MQIPHPLTRWSHTDVCPVRTTSDVVCMPRAASRSCSWLRAGAAATRQRFTGGGLKKSSLRCPEVSHGTFTTRPSCSRLEFVYWRAPPFDGIHNPNLVSHSSRSIYLSPAAPQMMSATNKKHTKHRWLTLLAFVCCASPPFLTPCRELRYKRSPIRTRRGIGHPKPRVAASYHDNRMMQCLHRTFNFVNGGLFSFPECYNDTHSLGLERKIPQMQRSESQSL